MSQHACTNKKTSLSSNRIATLQGVVFPPRLTKLDLECNEIESQGNAVFPSTLKHLALGDNHLTTANLANLRTDCYVDLGYNPLVIDRAVVIYTLSHWGSRFRAGVFEEDEEDHLCLAQTIRRLMLVICYLQGQGGFPPMLLSLIAEMALKPWKW